MINLDRQLYYTYNNKKYKSKWLALQSASDDGFKGFDGYSKIGVALGNHLKPFSDANWDEEPKDDWMPQLVFKTLQDAYKTPQRPSRRFQDTP